MQRQWIKSATRVVAALSGIAALVAVGLSVAAYHKVNWRFIRGLDNEQVAPNTFFQELRVGDYESCVSLRVLPVNGTGQATTRETCYRTYVFGGQHKTKVHDLVTGERLVLGPACSADRAWVARVLGIPRRVDVVALWDKQCSGLRWVNFFGFYSGILAALWLAIAMLDVVMDKQDEPEWRQNLWLAVTTTGTVGQVALTAIWLNVFDVSGLHVGTSLRFSMASSIIMVWTWLVMTSGFAVSRVLRGSEHNPATSEEPTERPFYEVQPTPYTLPYAA
ncbi:hypothetical protein PINS_up012477 [Pythium insidiosum]|nr:hypothetical protein PINS_up012477 [Pythium insidiosum]